MDIILEEQTIFLFIVAIIVALIARRFSLPYTVGLVITGIFLDLAHIKSGLSLTHEFIFDIILPPLLFEAALNISWKELRRDMLPILLLAIVGVIVSAIFVAWGMVHLLGWSWQSSLVFGVLIAATDPVAVIALFKDTGVKGRLRLLVESESLFNDGVAAVLFAFVTFWAQHGNEPVIPLAIAQALALTVGGGIAIGAICSIVAIYVAGQIEDHLVETALTAAVAFGSFLFAEHLHASGILATVTAGLLMGNHLGVAHGGHAESSISKRGHAFILDFWEFIAFLADSLIFLLIGLRAATIPFSELGMAALLIIIILIITSRALSVYPLCLPLLRSKWAIPLDHQHILWWGGLRGALALALALSLPESLKMHDEILIATFGVVAFSVVIQGLTMPALLKVLKCGRN